MKFTCQDTHFSSVTNMLACNIGLSNENKNVSPNTSILEALSRNVGQIINFHDVKFFIVFPYLQTPCHICFLPSPL